MAAGNRHFLEKYVVICGMGHVGTRVADLLLRLGYGVVAISKETPVSVVMAADERLKIINGDARSAAVLKEAGLDGATAVMLLTDDDLANVSIALSIRSANPHVKLILRLFDQRLAGILKKKLNLAGVFSASLVAAPMCVAHAMGEEVAAAFLHRDSFYTVDKNNFGAEKEPLITLRKTAQKRTSSIAEGLGNIRNALHWFPRPALLVLGALALISALGVMVFMWRLHMKGIDALYFLITIITTVGFGDYNFLEASAGMKLFGCLLMLSGAALIAALFSIITDVLLRFRLKSLLVNVTSKSKDHVIVIGVGSFGYRVMLALQSQRLAVVAVEHDAVNPFLTAARELAPVLIGDGRLEETLVSAGIARAKALVVLTGSDMANLTIALAAKQAWPHCRIVCRLYDSALAEKAEGLLNVDNILSTSAIAAPVIVGAVLQNDVVSAFLTADALHLFSQTSPQQSEESFSSTVFPFIARDTRRAQ